MYPRILRRSFNRAWMALLLCLLGSAPALAAHPALWRAQDADTTVYFFGTVHTLPKNVHWHFPALDKALDASKVLYVEAADINPATLQPLVLKYGVDPAHPLSDKLDAKENALLQKAAKQVGLPGGAATLDIMKPWLAGITIATAPLIKAGFDPKLGVDKQLQAQFKKAGKPVKGLESARKQILIFAHLPESMQLDLLRQTLHDYAHAETELNAIIDAWKIGDVKALAHSVDIKMKKQSPKLYQVILVDRNQAWAQQIAKLMQTTPGTIFIAVGAGHLAGPDRVQLQLQKFGIRTQRMKH